MKLLIAKPGQVPSGWVWIHTDGLTPAEIRDCVQVMSDTEEKGGPEHCIATLNRTVLDMVRCGNSKGDKTMIYKDVQVWKDGQLCELLSLHKETWLSHFRLGDLLESGDI